MSSYAQMRAREMAGEFTRAELLHLIRELRFIYYSKVRRAAKYYRQPTPTPVPMGRPPLLVTIDGDGVRTDH